MLTGYCDRLSAVPGSRITVHASTDAPWIDLRLVRLTGPATAPAPGQPRELPVLPVPGTLTRVPGLVQRTARAGSFGIAAVAPALPSAVTFAAWIRLEARTPGRLQGILARRDAGTGEGLALALDEEGRPCAVAGDVRLRAGRALPLRTWCLLAAGLDGGTGELSLSVVPAPRSPIPAEHLRQRLPGTAAAWPDAPLVLAAAGSHAPDGHPVPGVVGLLNGKVEQPFVCDRLLDARELDAVAADVTPPQDLSPLHHWDLGHDTDSATAPDLGRAATPLTLLNAPTLAMTGHRFDGRYLSPAESPAHYGGAHFHDDDLDDVRWTPTAVLDLPDGLVSGLYAVRLETADETDHITFCVPTPRRGAARTGGRAVFLVSTMTMMAYANSRVPRLPTAAGHTGSAANRLFEEHTEWGSSTYDFHSDGSGVSLASSLRPMPGLRPDYQSRVSTTPGLLGAQLGAVAWLERAGVDYDVISDHDLHAWGPGALDGYDVVITSSHPEYVTEEILDSLDAFQRDGGSLMYLGGNGFYWVTSISPQRPHLMEIRRSHSGTRGWSNEPGETGHATTGVPGGLWRHRGRTPQALTGVGMAACGGEPSDPGYRSLPDAADPRAAFVFEGVDVPAPGTTAFLVGAAGNEVDRTDSALGTPEHALRLATSEGLHQDTFTTATEDLLILEPGMGLGGSDPRVRSDIVFYETGFGGAVFSVGSISWGTALPADDYANDVARVSTNVLRRFLEPAPFTVDFTGQGS